MPPRLSEEEVSMIQDEPELLKKILQKIRTLKKKNKSPPRLVNKTEGKPEITVVGFFTRRLATPG